MNRRQDQPNPILRGVVVAVIVLAAALAVLLALSGCSSSDDDGEVVSVTDALPKCVALTEAGDWYRQAQDGCADGDGSLEVFATHDCHDGRRFAYSEDYAGFVDGRLVDRHGVDTSSFDNPDYAACYYS